MTPCCIWLFGLPCSGKTTIAEELKPMLPGFVVHLDGDVMRRYLCSDLGFSGPDRAENLRRFRMVARLLMDAGATVIVSAITPTESAREAAKEECAPCLLVHVDTPAEVCERRDVKGMWAKARAGQIADFTGVSAPFKAAESVDLTVYTDTDPNTSAVAVVDALRRKALL